ncbi:MAG TPA: hypothetical protein ENK04_12730 [Gammaproteobacteria bacterium]|nr:hypothetical protein [Gammaproteobacteria bacterium]
MKKFIRLYATTIFVALSTLLLTACGGGGDNAPPPPAANGDLTGVFIDSPVAGLRYETASQSGFTNASGEFIYRAGETVTFRLGGAELGSAAGQSQITLFDLAGIAPPTGNTLRQSSLQRVINTAVMLQTLDADYQLTPTATRRDKSKTPTTTARLN